MDGISNQWCLDCLLKCLFRHRSKKISKIHVTGLCEGNPSVTGGFPSQRASNTGNVSIWLRYHDGVVLWQSFVLMFVPPSPPWLPLPHDTFSAARDQNFKRHFYFSESTPQRPLMRPVMGIYGVSLFKFWFIFYLCQCGNVCTTV